MIDKQHGSQIEVLDFLNHCSELVPGFKQAYAFYFNPSLKEIKAVLTTKDNQNNQVNFKTDSTELSLSIEQLRRSNIKYEWVEESDLPFELHQRPQQIQKKVFDELQHHILLIRSKNTFDNKNDLLYIFFKPDASNFGLKSINSKLSTEHKSIIEILIYRSFTLFCKQREEYKNSTNQLISYHKILGEQLKKFQHENKTHQHNYNIRISEYISFLFEKEALENNTHIHITQEADSFIKNYKGPISHIEKAVKSSYQMAIQLQEVFEGSIIKIEEFYLTPHFSQEEQHINNTNLENIADTRYHKTIKLLNRLENAAKKVRTEGRALNGSNVGQAMDNPISAPAISDALKKHQKKIQSLCNEYPEEWTLIRKSFKPIINTLSA